MNNSTLAIDVDSIVFDGASRSSKWKSLRKYLKLTLAAMESNADRISFFEKEIQRVSEENNNLIKIIATLSDLANEEEQREISLTLNDMDYDIVIDTAPPAEDLVQESSSALTFNQAEDHILPPKPFPIEELSSEFEKLPKIGSKLAANIAQHILDTDEEAARRLLSSIEKQNDSVQQHTAKQQSLL